MFGGQKRGSRGEMVTITENAWPSLLTLISARRSEGEAARLKYESLLPAKHLSTGLKRAFFITFLSEEKLI